MRVAYEWDQLEKALQANDFWFFLQNESGWQHNRIRFLFELVAKGRELSHLEREDPHRLFLAFQKWFEEGEKREEHVADTEWARVRDTFMMLEEWFEDRQLFHLVGFLIWKGVNISKIQGIAGSQTKRKFLKSLKRGVFISVFGSGEEVPDFTNAVEVDEFIGDALEELSYGRSSLKIRSVLLLFNIATLLQSKQSNARFQFEEFKAEKWELEHIRSVASAAPDKKREREIFLSDCLGYLRTQGEEELSSQIEAFSNSEEMAEEEREDAFENLYLAILKHFKEDKEEEADNGIGNLTLLDRGTNRGYKNAVFPVKRQYLLSRDEAGIFVPVCTRNVFLKCYNPRVDNLMFWSAEDREAYRKKIQEVLTHFFNESQ